MVTCSKAADLEGPYRYNLTRDWAADRPTLIVCGTNPSVANHLIDDNTVRVLVNFGDRTGHGRLLMLNVYAWKDTHFKNLLAAARQGCDVIGPRNTFAHLYAQILNEKTFSLFAAWGNDGYQRGLELFNHYPELPWQCFGKTSSGAPGHPLHRRLIPQELTWKSGSPSSRPMNV